MNAGPRLARAGIAALLGLAICAPVRAVQAQQWIAHLTGAAEAPPNASPGTGTMMFTLVSNTELRIQGSFSGLVSNTTAAHVHCCTNDPNVGTAGVATTTPTFPLFPLGVTTGSFDYLMDLTAIGSFNTSFVNNNGGTALGAWAALEYGMNHGLAYFNIHTVNSPGGEIRGFITPVPEPGSALLVVTGLGVLALRRRRPR